MDAEWKDIDGLYGVYEVSSEGVVRDKRNGRVLTQSSDGKPRVSFNVKVDGVPVHSSKMVSRIVAETFMPHDYMGYDRVRHMDGDPYNNRIENLAWASKVGFQHRKKSCKPTIEGRLIDIRDRLERIEEKLDILLGR